MASTDKPPIAKPTAKQLRYLRTLAKRTGTTFTYPATRRHATEEIERLLAINRTGFTFAELQAERAARAANDDVPVDFAPGFQAHEVTGYGATATWSQRA